MSSKWISYPFITGRCWCQDKNHQTNLRGFCPFTVVPTMIVSGPAIADPLRPGSITAKAISDEHETGYSFREQVKFDNLSIPTSRRRTRQYDVWRPLTIGADSYS